MPAHYSHPRATPVIPAKAGIQRSGGGGPAPYPDTWHKGGYAASRSSYVAPKFHSCTHRRNDSLSTNCLNNSVSS